MELVTPAPKYVGSYLHAVRGGWDWEEFYFGDAAPALVRAERSTSSLLEAFRGDGRGLVRHADGSMTPRLPSDFRFIWDGGFAGSINLRWQPGTHALPPTCLGHIGYGVVPRKRRRGLATAALKATLPLAWAQGLEYVEIVTDPQNLASQSVIKAAGGVFIEEYELPDASGGGRAYRWRIDS